MNENRKLTKKGAGLIKHFESCMKKDGNKFRSYTCPAGVATIGWGHTGHHGRKFDATSRWTAEECDEVFMEDMEGFERAVRKHVRVPLNAHQYDALVSLCYNIGETAFAKSTLVRKINAGDLTGAAAEFKRWNKGGGKVLPGLVRRRASEALMFQGVPDENYDGKADLKATPYPMAQAVDDPENDHA